MSKMKHKRNLGAPKPSYAERLRQKEEEARQRKMGWTHNVYVFTQQETLDIASIALHQEFGFGPERLKRFMAAFASVFSSDMENHREDMRVDDHDHWYSTQKMEDAMKEAWGPAYETRDQRYEFDYVMESPNKPVVDQ